MSFFRDGFEYDRPGMLFDRVHGGGYIEPSMTLVWEGWQADIGRLVAHGWKLYHNQSLSDYRRMSIDVALMHPDGICTGHTTLEREHFRPMGRYMAYASMRFDMTLAREIALTVPTKEAPRWQEMHLSFMIRSLQEEIRPEKIDMPNEKDIIVDPPTVAQLLAQIRDMQKPRARELLKQEKQRQELEKFNVEARILTIV